MTQPSILIVDDDVDTREAMKFFLESHRYTVVVAANGAGALGKLRADLRPCLILLDLLMPEKNGFQFRVEQVLDPELSELPVAICSGDPDASSSGTVLGAVAHLEKPIDVDKLLAVVRTYCGAR